jgi:hypothetical protein
MTGELHQIDLPEELVGGVYADFVSVWHTPATFTFDFAAMAGPAEPAVADDGQEINLLKSRIVARVRIPPQQVFEIMKALEQQLTAWENEQRPTDTPAA